MKWSIKGKLSDWETEEIAEGEDLGPRGDDCALRGCRPGVDLVSREAEGMFCDKRRYVKEFLFESGALRESEAFVLCDCRWDCHTCHKVHSSPDQCCGLFFFLDCPVASFCAHLTDMERTFPTLKFSLDLRSFLPQSRSSSSNESKKKPKGVLVQNRVSPTLQFFPHGWG